MVGLFLVLEQSWTGQRHVLIFPRHAFHVLEELRTEKECSMLD